MKVLIIYSIDHNWDNSEISDTRSSNKILFESLKKEGIETYLEELGHPDLETILDRYKPEETIVFNLCEFLPGIPDRLDKSLFRRLEEKVFATLKGFGCLDYARFDFRLRDNKFYLLDINPNNDISFNTSFAMAAEMKSYSYSQIVKRIVMMAAQRHPVFAEKW